MSVEVSGRSDFNWKKWLKIGAGAVISLFVVRMLFATLFYGEVFKLATNFNNGFISGQPAIHEKIESSAREFDRELEQSTIRDAKDHKDFEENMERMALRDGKELAQYIVRTKHDYEMKMEQCTHDKECIKYLNNFHFRVMENAKGY